MKREFLLWTDERFVGFAESFHEAKDLAHRQESGESVYIVDFNSSPETQCLVLAGGAMLTGRMGWSNCLQGLQLAAAALAASATAKRDQMLRMRAAISARYPLGLPSIDSPPNRDWEIWRSVERNFEEAKAQHSAFCERYGPLAH